MLAVTVAGQSNAPRVFRYADTFGQRTVALGLVLQGNSAASFPRWKARLLHQVLEDALRADGTLDVPEGGVHIGGVAPAAEQAVVLSVNVSAKNPNMANATATWIANPARQAALLKVVNNLAVQEGRLGAVASGMAVHSPLITKDVYCPPGQQAQEINATTDRACFACPVGYFQPTSSVEPCVPCPLGTPAPPRRGQ